MLLEGGLAALVLDKEAKMEECRTISHYKVFTLLQLIHRERWELFPSKYLDPTVNLIFFESPEINAMNYIHFAPKGEIQLGKYNFAIRWLFLSWCFSQAKKSQALYEQKVSGHIALKRTNWPPAAVQKTTSISFPLNRSNTAFFTHYNSSPGDNSCTLLLAKHQTVMSVSIFPL